MSKTDVPRGEPYFEVSVYRHDGLRLLQGSCNPPMGHDRIKRIASEALRDLGITASAEIFDGWAHVDPQFGFERFELGIGVALQATVVDAIILALGTRHSAENQSRAYVDLTDGEEIVIANGNIEIEP